MHYNVGCMAAVCVGLLSGCVQTPAPVEPCRQEIVMINREDPARILQLTGFASWVERQPPEVLDDLLQRDQQRRKHNDPPLLGSIERALLLSRPGTDFQNDHEALSLLQQAHADAKPDEQAFIALQQNKLRERTQLATYWKNRLTIEQQRRQKMEQQLEDLKAIETDLSPRNGRVEGDMP